jgi:metal-dependent amidase/aminoacylase/carboxypeptidase family protein
VDGGVDRRLEARGDGRYDIATGAPGGEQLTGHAPESPLRQLDRRWPADAADLTGLARAWDAALAGELPNAVDLRHRLHAEPEVSGAEERTAALVARALGGDAETVAGTGQVVRIGPPGPAVAVRAELDGLPVAERTGAVWASSNGAMHACGHDVHLAAVVAAARAARRLPLPAGLVVALVPAGAVSADPGPVNAAVDEIEITITGRGGHSAYPHLAADPVPALCAAVPALQEAVRSAVDPLRPVVLTLPQISGAGAPNVIAERACAAGTLRSMHLGDASLLHERLARTVEGIAAAHGCRGELVVRRGEPPLVNDGGATLAAHEVLAALGVPLAPFASMGSDDFASYGVALPTLMLFVGTGEGPAGPMLHDPRYLPADDRVRDVARALVAGWTGAVRATVPGVEHATSVRVSGSARRG